MQVDRATSQNTNAEDVANQIQSRLEKTTNKSASDLSIVVKDNKAVHKNTDRQSTSLNNFRETIKDVLEEITSLEVNTMIVGNIPIKKFDAKEFYEERRNEAKNCLLY